MKKIKTFLLIAVAFLLSVAGIALTSCDDVSKDPKAYPDKLYFSAKGGSQTVEVKSMDGTKLSQSWRFERLYLLDKNDYYLDSVATRKIETLSDGSRRIESDWVVYTISSDQKNIKVEVAANTTNNPRAIAFDALGGVAGFVLTCFQEAGNAQSSAEK